MSILSTVKGWVTMLLKKKAKEDDDLVSVTVTAEVTSDDIDLSDK